MTEREKLLMELVGIGDMMATRLRAAQNYTSPEANEWDRIRIKVEPLLATPAPAGEPEEITRQAEKIASKYFGTKGSLRTQLTNEIISLCAAHPPAEPGLTVEQFREIAFRHRTIVVGYEFADKFDFAAIVNDLNILFSAKKE